MQGDVLNGLQLEPQLLCDRKSYYRVAVERLVDQALVPSGRSLIGGTV